MAIGANLFPKPPRVCCVCACEASNGSRQPVAGEPVVLAITPIVYRRGNGKGRVRNASRVHVCEKCLTKAATSGRLEWINSTSPKLLRALSSAILDCLVIMTQDDEPEKAAPVASPSGQLALL